MGKKTINKAPNSKQNPKRGENVAFYVPEGRQPVVCGGGYLQGLLKVGKCNFKEN